MHGGGFTLYATCPDSEGDAVDREGVWLRAAAGEFDAIVFSSVWRQVDELLAHRHIWRTRRTVIIDTEDSGICFPWSGNVGRRGVLRMIRAAWSVRRVPRFMRERPDTWWPSASIRRPSNWLTNALSHTLLAIAPPEQISFSVPEEYIVEKIPVKDRDFFDHVVDEDTASCIPGSSVRPPYESERAYVDGIRRSRFGITRKRAGWDCLRHYEFAANGCVPCFRFLDRKPRACAPHGLDATNCILYSDPDEMIQRVTALTDAEYQRLAEGALKWAHRNSTVVRASDVLNRIGLEVS